MALSGVFPASIMRIRFLKSVRKKWSFLKTVFVQRKTVYGYATERKMIPAERSDIYLKIPGWKCFN